MSSFNKARSPSSQAENRSEEEEYNKCNRSVAHRLRSHIWNWSCDPLYEYGVGHVTHCMSTELVM